MKKFYYSLLILGLLWLCLGLLSLRFQLPVPSVKNRNFKHSLSEMVGSVHFHTLQSDGSGTSAQIIEAAQEANLDFIIATDHANGTGEKIAESEVPYNSSNASHHPKSLLLFSESEIGTEEGHYLKIDGMKIIAHPFDPFIPWKNAEPGAEYDGIEIVNGASLAHDGIKKIFPALWALLFYPFNPNYSFLSIYENPVRELKFWDELNEKKKMAGFVATDAHANINLWQERGWRIKFPSYAALFKTMKMHLVTIGNLRELPFSKAKKLLYNNLVQGKAYFAIDLLLDSSGFLFELWRTQKGRGKKDRKIEMKAEMGETVKLRKGEKSFTKALLGIQIPSVPKEIRLLRNGETIATTNSEGLEFEINEAGVYRTEVYLTIKNIFGMKRKVLWIGSNPIVVK